VAIRVKASGSAPAPVRRRRPAAAVTGAALSVVVLFSVVRELTGATDLTSSGTSGSALRLTVPVLLAGLGGLYAERAGVVNIGLEGMMILGAWFGAWGALHFGPWWGVALGLAGGAAGGAVHAFATVRFGVDHIVSGVAVNLLAAGVARFLSALAYEGLPGGGATQSPRISGGLGRVTVPVLAGGDVFGWHSPDVLGWLERRHWTVVSDLAGLARGLTGDVSWLAVGAVLLIPASVWLLWRTPFGLRLRAAGEYPAAAESLGVNVYRLKEAGVIVSGALAGLGGAFLVLEGAGLYREGMTDGRGFLGLAAVIFGNWRPQGVALGAGLFGFASALQLRDERAVHALLLCVALALLPWAGREMVKRRAGRAMAVLVLAGGFLVAFATTDAIPRPFVFFAPHLTTLVVLALAGPRLRPPAAVGLFYRRGQLT
jgi:simple sugar transport system permease protein